MFEDDEPHGRESDLAADGADASEYEYVEADTYADRSLLGDLAALIDDGKTYLEAELGFQKTRVTFALDRAKWLAGYGLAALLIAFVALIGLTVGLIITLIPLIGPLAATALVVGLLLIAAGLLAGRALRSLREIQNAFSDDSRPGENGGGAL